MKRVTSLIIILCSVLSMFAQKPFYVNMNDGTVKAFLTSQVDSIIVSSLDVDSIEQDHIVTQEIWTPDSVYRIPLSLISSIDFTVPETEFKQDAINVSEKLEQYVISADESHIYLSLSTPKQIVPSIGDKLGYDKINDLFPYGFCAKVVEVNERSSDIEISCEQVSLEEVFDTFYFTLQSKEQDKSSKSKSTRVSISDGNFYRVNSIHVPLPTQEFGDELSMKLSPNSNIAYSVGTSASVDMDNYFDVTLFVILNRDMGLNFQSTIIGRHDVNSSISLSGNISYDDHHKIITGKVPIAFGIALYAEPGWFYNVSLGGTVSLNTTQHYMSGASFGYSSKGKSVLKPSLKIRHTGTDFNAKAILNGSASVGGYFEIGLTFIDPIIDKIAYQFEAGAECKATIEVYNSDLVNSELNTSLYQKLRNSEVTISPFISHSSIMAFGPFENKLTLNKMTGLPLWKRDFVPTFSDITIGTTANSNNAIVMSDLTGNCLFPIPVGYKLFDKQLEECSKLCDEIYDHTPGTLIKTFENLENNAVYSVYPLVNFLGFDLLALPDKKFKIGNNVPDITDFTVTKSQYKEKGFVNDGEAYDFRFDATVTAEFYPNDPSLIQEWGYVYEDPKGQKTYVPLSGTKASDSSYAYFRNSAHSTARLYGYVYVRGIEQPIYGPIHDFPLDHIMAVANTGDCVEVKTKSATVNCSFENIPQGAKCGVEYLYEENWLMHESNSSEGTQTITLNGLQPGTKYYYRAYIDDNGQMYYGSEKEFTTEYEIPDITGTWNCNIYNEDGSVLNSLSITLTGDGKATQQGSDRIPENTIGGWSVGIDGKVGVSFSWDGVRWTWFGEQFSGQVNSLTNPSQIEGTVWRGYATEMHEGGTTYRFVMTK